MEDVRAVLKSVFAWTSVKESREKIKRSIKKHGG